MIANIQSRIRLGGLELTVDTEQGHQVPSTAELEIEDVGFVVADMAEQLAPNRSFIIDRQRRSVLRLTCQRSARCFSVIPG